MKLYVFILVALVAFCGCSPAFSSSSGSGGEAGSTSTSSTDTGSGGRTETGGGGSGGSVETGGSGGGSPERIVLSLNFPNHAPDKLLGIAGFIDFPEPNPDIVPNVPNVLLPACLAAQATDTHVSCDVGPALPGTVLHIDLNTYNPDGSFAYYGCDNPTDVGAAIAQCDGGFSVMAGVVLIAACAGPDPLISPCAAEVNPQTGRRRYVITL